MQRSNRRDLSDSFLNMGISRRLRDRISGKRMVIIAGMIGAISFSGSATVVKGVVSDLENREPLIGATVMVSPGGRGVATDLDGGFVINVPEGRYTIESSYVGYQTETMKGVKVSGDTLRLDIGMKPDQQTLSEVVVTARQRHDSQLAQVEEQKRSMVVQTGVSAQEVIKTQDRDASEVIKRIPGVSIIDEKFVMVRGLSQRYNNVWLNGSAVPSSEADSRAFSFDIIPSSQLDNMVIVKSPAPEYPADFTGGFVLVNTRREPLKQGVDISLGVGINDRTHFREFVTANGSSSDWIGFDDGMRHLDFGMNGTPTFYGIDSRIDPIASGFNNDWHVKSIHPICDLKLNVGYSHKWNFDDGQSLSLISSVNYSNSYRTYLDMENSLYGPYDITNDKEVALRKATDNQYSHDIRLGAMLNMTYRPSNPDHLIEWKNVFNQTSKIRYSERLGFNAQSDNINEMEYYYSSRPTFNTQVTGQHTVGENKIDWSAGYAFAQKDLPDRRLIERTDRTDQTMGIYRISREFSILNEHTMSVSGNYSREIRIGSILPMVKAGLYGEYRTRDYRTRQFQYGWQPDNTLPSGFMFDPNVQDNVLIDSNYGPDKLYMYEEVNYLNNYKAHGMMGAGYVGINVPWSHFDFYAGVRYEYNRQTLEMNTRQFEESLQKTNYDYSDFFPSVNITYHLNDKHQIRAAYGRSINRPEFRELSSSVYYDFDLGSNVMGNPDLKAAYIDNVDLRWEWYPSKGETVSVALFYKHFRNPIEWTYTVTGGTDLIYSYINALGANNYGIEVDIRKSLDFLGLRGFSWSFNGSLIKSKVQFDGTGNNIDRPMQGQSPYLINTGIFYSEERYGWNAAILYNIIGKRIIGVGNRYGTASDGSSRNIPNSYEMPRNSLDLSGSKKFGNWNVKLSIRDLIAQRYIFKQIEEVETPSGTKTIEETTRNYRPGRTFNLSVGYTF